MPARTRVGLVIPAWNEAEAIGAVLDEVPANTVDQILVVVGSTSDPTAAVAESHGARVLVQRGPGYGAACWTGAAAALADGAQIVAFIDGDHADPPADLPRVLAPILNGRADLVLGCRDLSRFPDALPSHAQAGNRLILAVLRVLLGAQFTDLPSFKAIHANALRQLDMHEMSYGWTVEMLVKARRALLRVEEVGVEYRPRMGGRSKVGGSLKGSLGAAAGLLGCSVSYLTWRPV
jgi:glycosyltransferase involved in cell wall biosynthesis